MNVEHIKLKDERPTSNIERRTSNNDVARVAQALAVPRAAPQIILKSNKKNKSDP